MSCERCITPSPPPEYESVIGITDYKDERLENNSDTNPFSESSDSQQVSYQPFDATGLPSYDMAIALESSTTKYI